MKVEATDRACVGRGVYDGQRGRHFHREQLELQCAIVAWLAKATPLEQALDP